jgi:hypothetical protein
MDSLRNFLEDPENDRRTEAIGYCCGFRWRSVDEAEPRRLIELSSILLIGAFLASTFAFPHYGIFLLPHAVSIADPSSPFRDLAHLGGLVLSR